jgi:chromosome segregation ATPase
MKWLSRIKKATTIDTTDKLPKGKKGKEIQIEIDELKMEAQAKTISDMPDKQNKKKAIKELQKEVEKLRDEYEKIELRPCRGDADLHQRENELEILKSKISQLEKERDKYLYSWVYEA